MLSESAAAAEPYRQPPCLRDSAVAAVASPYLQHPSTTDGVGPSKAPLRDSTTVKALVWFWLINETLSANLLYQSDYEIDSTTPSD